MLEDNIREKICNCMLVDISGINRFNFTSKDHLSDFGFLQVFV
jgi:hypothetical protein